MSRASSLRWVVLVGASLLVAPWVANASPAAIARIESLLAGMQSLRATFTQEVHDGQGRLTQSSAGTFLLQKPGRFRWDYRTPPQSIVADGTRLWFHDADLAQVTVRRQRDVLAQTPAMLLAGKGRVGEGYDAEEIPAASGLEWLRLIPRGGGGDFRELRFGFSGGELRELELVDRLGQRTTIRFASLERNLPLPADTFRFKPPPDTDIVGETP